MRLFHLLSPDLWVVIRIANYHRILCLGPFHVLKLPRRDQTSDVDMNRTIRRLFNIAIFLCLCSAVQVGQSQVSLSDFSLADDRTYLLQTVEGHRYAGRVDFYDRSGLVMTRRNGRIAILKPDEIKAIKEVDNQFYPQNFQQMREKLQKEFGSKYVVSITEHFLVVHPPGDYEKWALPFEQLYLRVAAYFKTRGLTIHEPEFPMVAVVLRTRNEFVQMAQQRNAASNVIGYYAFHSNRLIAYQQKIPWRNEAHNWADTMSTIIHEATHQTAANIGIHSRIGVNPRWVTEGLATMFEAKGVNNFFKYPNFNDRINWGRLKELRELYKEGEVEGTVQQLIESDALFKHDSKRAYAVSWAMSLYLAERYPRKYAQYLGMLQKKELTSSISVSNRVKYFQKAFGDPAAIEAGVRAFADRMPQSEAK